MHNPAVKKLIKEYICKKPQIRKRLKEFKNLQNVDDEKVFSELCFCILTPQSKAVSCDKAIKNLESDDLLLNGSRNVISKKIRGLTRFHNNKAVYIVAARKFFTNGGKLLDIKDKLDKKDIFKTREWLVKNIKGIGYKEASHFLRNIGLGKNIAILDTHILKCLRRCGVFKKPLQPTSKKTYLKTEERMRQFSKKIDISMEELDLLFWSQQTGFIFK